MYRYRSRRKKSFLKRHGGAIALSIAGIASASFGFLGPASSDIDTNTRVFSEGLQIKLDRGSPAFAALEDTWFSARMSEDEAGAAARLRMPAVRIGANAESAESLAEKLIKDNRREESLLAQERVSRQASSHMMVEAAAQLLKKVSDQLVPETNTETETEVREISLSELKITREELLGGLFLPIAHSAAETGRDDIASSRPQVPSFPSRGGGKTNPMTADTGGSYSEVSVPPLRQVVLTGHIEFSEGLALTNPMDRLVVYRDVEGEPVEAGAVWIREARYEIFVEETVGHLIGELRTPYGDIIGRGLVDLSHISVGKDPRERKVSGVNLEIKPVPQGVSGHIVVADNKERTSLKSAAVSFPGINVLVKTDSEGRYWEPNVLEGSSLVVRADRPGYWGTLAFAHVGDNKDLSLFADSESSTIRSLIAKNIRESETSGVVWGRVTYNGKTVAGARVELMTGEDVRPIYFNAALLPDPSLKETSANGLYAFFPVSVGAHAVQVVWRNGRTSEPRVFPTEAKTVSQVDIEASKDRVSKVKVFDAFSTDYPLSAEVSYLGNDRHYAIDRSGVREIKYAGGPGLLVLDAHAGPAYEKARLALSRDRRLIYFPMVQTAWLNQLRGTARINSEPGRGSVVGFVQGASPYKVNLDSQAASTRVYYFNSRGEMTSTDYGEPGGGFVIFNVEEGFRTFTIMSSGSLKTYSSVALIERNIVSLVSHWIR